MDLGAILYPSLLICFLFGIILVVGFGFAHLWLIVLHRQMSKCPQCERKGAGDIVASEVISTKNHMDYKHDPPARVTVKTLEDRYECQYCGHVWTRTAQQTTRRGVKP